VNHIINSPEANYKTVFICRACNQDQIVTILDLQEQPLANSYHQGEQLEEFPLKLNLCVDCFHLQLSIVVNPDLMFKNYLYVSGTAQTLRDYFDDFARKVIQDTGLAEGSVLDIACNDGSQLDSFKKLNWTTYGVDPAENLYKLSSKKGHHIICDYWTADSANELNQKFDVIIAQNVFAHTHDIYQFLETCKKVMKEDTKIYIQTSQANMINKGEFDTIYHEHLSFFSLKSAIAIANRCNLNITKGYRSKV